MMGVIFDEHRFFYAPAPKIACTSLKHMFFECENGFDFRMYRANGESMHIHNVAYKTLLWEYFPKNRIADYHRITVVRDPVKRFLSAYANRVVHHGELSESAAGQRLSELGLEANPGLDLFIEKYKHYAEAHPSIHHHTRPMVDFLGRDKRYYQRVYAIEDLNTLVTETSERLGKPMTLKRLQTGGPKLKTEDLSPRQLSKIKSLYHDDYAVFGDYF